MSAQTTHVVAPDKKPSTLNVALIGANHLCVEVLEKTTFGFEGEDVSSHIQAVADSDSEAPGMTAAKKLGLETVSDYHDLYHPRFDIHLIVILIPDDGILLDVLNTRPTHIRIMSCQVFELFWKAIGREEKKLRERNREVETILNGIEEFIIVLSPEMVIIDVNDTFLKQMGYTRDEVIGRKCHEVFQKANLQCGMDVVVCPLNEAIRNERPGRRIMTRVNNRGALRHIEITIYPIWEKTGKISRFIEVSRDITDRKREEEEITQRLEKMVEERTRQLKETHDKLIHKDKMASLGKLSASVVHELNNPIAGILNFILLIKRINEEEDITQKEKEQFNQYLSLMETETRRISRIVSNLLAFSRQAQLELIALDVNRLVEKTFLLNSNLLKINKIRMEKNLDPTVPDIIGSEDQLQQVFMNIIYNAVEAMETVENGSLSVATRLSSGKDAILASFQDTGIGIPEKNLTRLFEPFFTTKKRGKGVGLGLSVAYGIVQEHGGTMHVTSIVGGGTCFTVELPLRHKMDS